MRTRQVIRGAQRTAAPVGQSESALDPAAVGQGAGEFGSGNGGQVEFGPAEHVEPAVRSEFWVIGSLVPVVLVVSIPVTRPRPWQAVLQLVVGSVQGTLLLGVLAGSVREFVGGLRGH
ncbi:MAG TPA: hypothetical protein VIS06_14450 [Mycobacteriales bacterium]